MGDDVVLGDSEFKRLLVLRRKEYFEHARARDGRDTNTFLFTLDSDQAKSKSKNIALTKEQLECVAGIIKCNNSLKHTLNMGATKLSDEVYSVLLEISGCLSEIRVSYPLSDRDFARAQKIIPKVTLSSIQTLDKVRSLSLDGQDINLNSSVPRVPSQSTPASIKIGKIQEVLASARDFHRRLTTENKSQGLVIWQKINAYRTKKEAIKKIKGTKKNKSIRREQKTLLTSMQEAVTTAYEEMLSTKLGKEYFKMELPFEEVFAKYDEHLAGIYKVYKGDVEKYSEWKKVFAALLAKAETLGENPYDGAPRELQQEVDYTIMLFSDYVSISEVEARPEARRNPASRAMKELQGTKLIQEQLLTIASENYALASKMYKGTGLNIANTLTDKIVSTQHIDIPLIVYVHAKNCWEYLIRSHDDNIKKSSKVAQLNASLSKVSEVLCGAIKTQAEYNSSYESLSKYYGPVYKRYLTYLNKISDLTKSIGLDMQFRCDDVCSQGTARSDVEKTFIMNLMHSETNLAFQRQCSIVDSTSSLYNYFYEVLQQLMYVISATKKHEEGSAEDFGKYLAEKMIPLTLGAHGGPVRQNEPYSRTSQYPKVEEKGAKRFFSGQPSQQDKRMVQVIPPSGAKRERDNLVISTNEPSKVKASRPSQGVKKVRDPADREKDASQAFTV